MLLVSSLAAVLALESLPELIGPPAVSFKMVLSCDRSQCYQHPLL